MTTPLPVPPHTMTAHTERDLADARHDPRYPVVLQEIQAFGWAAGASGDRTVPGDHADILATRVLATMRRHNAAAISTQDTVAAARAAVLEFALAPLTGDSNPPVETYATGLVDALVDAVQHAVEEQHLHAPQFRGCVFPTCLRMFDSMASFSGRTPARPEWSSQGWRQVRGSAVHSAGGYICSDHTTIVVAHFPHPGVPVFPGQLSARCTCGNWSVSGLRWHGTARGMWEEHLLDELDKTADLGTARPAGDAQ